MSYKTPYSLSLHQYYHVYNRGVNRKRIFLVQDNYAHFLRLSRRYHREDEIDIVAYCLMPNHFHFILYQKSQYAIARYMRQVCDAYVKSVNKAFSRTGHLLGGTYKIKPVSDQRYLSHLSRYIHVNPIHTNLTRMPEEWTFSSYRAYIGMEAIGILSPEHVLAEFGDPGEYRRFVEGYRKEEREVVADILCGTP